MKNIIYKQPEDAVKFDLERYKKSLAKYAKISEKDIKEALKSVEQYENMHVSVLVELGAAMIGKNAGDDAARQYLEAHKSYFTNDKFERLRRITGYLVGTLDRWNDGKKAEEAVRVKHSVNSCVDDLVRAAKLQDQALAHNVAYANRATA